MRKTFSITNKEVLERLESVDNQSGNVQDLILSDIYNRSNVNFERVTKNKLEEILKQVDEVVRALNDNKKGYR